MINGKGGGMSSWIGTGISLLVLVGGGATAYSNLNSKLTGMEVVIERNSQEIVQLDGYDVHLTEKVDELKGGAIRTEAEMGSLQRATDKLDFTMGEMLKEMKRMNDNLIRMGVSNSNGKD